MFVNETMTCVSNTPLTFSDGIVLGMLIIVLGVLIFALLLQNCQRELIRESIFNPDAFKVRQDEFNRKLKDYLP